MPHLSCLHRDPALRVLDDDILLQVFQELRPSRHLRPLSLTCKWIRKLCMGILFSSCTIRAASLSSGKTMFLPEQLWPYVRYVMFACRFD